MTVLKNDEKIAAVAPASDNQKDLFQFRDKPLKCFSKEHTVSYSFTNYLTAMCVAIRRTAIQEDWLFDPVYSPPVTSKI